MLVTNDPEWAARARYLTTQAKDDPIEYVHHAVGYNYRLTNILAAMGCAQMEQLDSFIEVKRGIAGRYLEALGTLPGVKCPEEAEWAYCTYWMYTVLVDEQETGIDSRGLLRRALASQKIQSRPLWQPMHQSPAHDSFGSPQCPNADVIHRQAISLPCSVRLLAISQERVIETLAALLRKQRASVGRYESNGY